MLARRDTRYEAARVRRLSPLQTVEDQSQAWGLCCHSCTWSCQLDTNIHLGRITAHNAVHRCEVAEMLQASPHDFRTGVVAPTAPHKPAELGDPGNCLAQRRRLSRWRRDPMDGTI